MRKRQMKDFVTCLGHYAPHIPYTAKQHLIDRNSGAFEPVYAALIETLEDTIGVLLDKLDELSLTDNTIFVFTSDNGGLHLPELPHERVTSEFMVSASDSPTQERKALCGRN